MTAGIEKVGGALTTKAPETTLSNRRAGSFQVHKQISAPSLLGTEKGPESITVPHQWEGQQVCAVPLCPPLCLVPKEPEPSHPLEMQVSMRTQAH